MRTWWVYMIVCRDGTIYTGMTNDLEKRLKAHNAGRGAKYTRGRGPVRLIYAEPTVSRRNALCWEAFLKKQPRLRKLWLAGFWAKHRKKEVRKWQTLPRQ